MPRGRKQDHVPTHLREHYNSLVELTDLFCATFLNDDYAQLARKAATSLSHYPRNTFSDGEYEKWACGIVYALGHNNFLFIRTSAPYIHPSTLCGHFGISQAEGARVARRVREILRMRRFEPDWFVPSRIASSPGIWMIMLDGKILDARNIPYELQVLAYHKGLIPSLPERAKPWPSQIN